MSKTIKVIDLLNKIANGEEVPKKIKYGNEIYEFNKDCKQYYREGKGSYYDDKLIYDKYDSIEERFYGDFLNDEVEIIEEQEEIDIQSIEEIKDIFIENSTCGEDVKYLARKYNEILKCAKQLDNEMKEINNGK